MNCAIMQLCAKQKPPNHPSEEMPLAANAHWKENINFSMKYNSRPCQTHSSARCKSSQGEKERLLPWLAENIRGKYCSEPAHQKQRAREKAVLDCRANKRNSFFWHCRVWKGMLRNCKGQRQCSAVKETKYN